MSITVPSLAAFVVLMLPVLALWLVGVRALLRRVEVRLHRRWAARLGMSVNEFEAWLVGDKGEHQ